MHPDERKIINRMRQILFPFIIGGFMWFAAVWMQDNEPDPFRANIPLINILHYLGLALCSGSLLAFLLLRWQYRRHKKQGDHPPRSDDDAHKQS